ncbi:signal transduction histidine kinase [Aquabacterium commune]|uniref:histidine kinase n=1 Tax=Aquabacterium commune TaxID=70586 RepID=A0A4R6R703_9BURK|nr:HAMP domain-containing sensor histidine kinase [Aquabacterium commune]TDP81594.1 signal transduction histidine kinase [Aquabacterium commune]
MSRYVVPPPRRVQREPGSPGARVALTRWLTALSAIGTFLVWWADERAGMNSTWASITVPMVSAVLGGSALAVWWRPHWHPWASAASTVASAIYFIGSLVSATISAQPNKLYEVASNAQFMPILYMAAFVVMVRGAALLSWLTYAGVVIAYLCLFGLPPPRNGDPLGHFWFTLLITHPMCILALSYISVLHSRLSRAELRAQADRERFLAMLSHEIRTPLQSMLGSIDLLDLKVRGQVERRAIDRLRQVAAQLEAHLRDVTEYTRLDNPSWQMHLQPVDLPKLVQDSCEALQSRARSRGLNLQCDIASDVRLRDAESDPTRVRQILDNLLHNALKYTAEGQITVRLAVRQARTRVHGAVHDEGDDTALSTDAVALSVHDTGLGIAPEAMAKIFEPYVRLEDRRLPRAEGTGLGLAVVRRLVDRLDGRLEVDSTPQQGTRFTVLLPLHGHAHPQAGATMS